MQLSALLRRQLADGIAEHRHLGALFVGFGLDDALERSIDLGLIERLGGKCRAYTEARPDLTRARAAADSG